MFRTLTIAVASWLSTYLAEPGALPHPSTAYCSTCETWHYELGWQCEHRIWLQRCPDCKRQLVPVAALADYEY